MIENEGVAPDIGAVKSFLIPGRDSGGKGSGSRKTASGDRERGGGFQHVEDVGGASSRCDELYL